jgi:flagellar basal body rod protein FlgC
MDMTIGRNGLTAASRQFDVAAFEIARASTQQPVQAPAGLSPGAAGLDTPLASAAAMLPNADADLPRNMVNLIMASNAVLANLQSIKRTDDTLRTLFADR